MARVFDGALFWIKKREGGTFFVYLYFYVLQNELILY